MAGYPNAFATPLYVPAPPTPVPHVPTAKDIRELYIRDVYMVKQHRGCPEWKPLHYCYCGRLTHLIGTSSRVPVFPMWEKDNLCIYHSPYRNVPII